MPATRMKPRKAPVREYEEDYREPKMDEGEMGDMEMGGMEDMADCHRNTHVHDHSGLTSCCDGHCHMHPGVTSGPIRRGCSHVHTAEGMTTYDDGHTHAYRTTTGPAVAVGDDHHTHHVHFRTSVADGHRHAVAGYIGVMHD